MTGIVWGINMLIALLFILCSWAAASEIGKQYKDVPAIDRNPIIFLPVWISLIILIKCVFSGLVLFRSEFKTNLNYGIMIGTFLICLHFGLVMAAYGQSQVIYVLGSRSIFDAFSGFGVLYFLSTITSSILFLLYRDEFLEGKPTTGPSTIPQYHTPVNPNQVNVSIPSDDGRGVDGMGPR